MKTDDQIRLEARACGHIETARLSLEVLLDIRRLLQVMPVPQIQAAVEQLSTWAPYAKQDLTEMAEHLRTMAEKPAPKPRKKRKKSAAKPAQ